MEDKLLFEVDITEGSTNEVAQALQLLGRDAVANGALECTASEMCRHRRLISPPSCEHQRP
jgi:hypothetical protein